jgi:D-sedoheptulose 7-phosphate isomerase
MAQASIESARGFLESSQNALKAAAESQEFLHALVSISDAIANTFKAGGKILLAGNGGSAGDAQHIAGEFLSHLNFDRAPLPAIALTVDTSVLTAVGNDYGYEQVFERQVRGLGRPGDIFVGISTSGGSRNVLRGLQAARELGLLTVGFTGGGPSEMTKLCDLVLAAPSKSTPLIQQIHITAAHIICGEVERVLFAKEAVDAA